MANHLCSEETFKLCLHHYSCKVRRLLSSQVFGIAPGPCCLTPPASSAMIWVDCSFESKQASDFGSEIDVGGLVGWVRGEGRKEGSSNYRKAVWSRSASCFWRWKEKGEIFLLPSRFFSDWGNGRRRLSGWTYFLRVLFFLTASVFSATNLAIKG